MTSAIAADPPGPAEAFAAVAGGAGRIARTVLVAVSVALLASCQSRSDERDMLEFWAMGHEGEVVQQLVPAFEARNPGARVRVQQVPWSAAHEKLLTAYVGGGMPDVVQVGNTWLPELAALGALVPVDVAQRAANGAPQGGSIGATHGASIDATPGVSMAFDPGDEFPGIAEATAIDGVRYGVPWYVDTRVLFYRSDLVHAAGADTPPTTWSGWVDVMARLARAGERYAVLLPTTEWEPPVILGLQRGATLLRDGDRFGDFESPAFRSALDFYRELFARGLAPRAGAAQSANLYQDFAAGYFAILISGPWNLGAMRARMPAGLADAWATAPLPSFDGAAPGVSLAGGASLAVVSTSARRDLAWRWIAFLAEPAQQLAFWKLTGDLPARPSAWERGALRDDARADAFWRQLAHVQAPPRIPEWERVAAKITEHAEGVARGDVALDTALGALDHDVDAILAKRRWMLDRAAGNGRGAPDRAAAQGAVRLERAAPSRVATPDRAARRAVRAAVDGEPPVPAWGRS